MTQYQWAILDIDGTLLDFQHAEAAALEATPRELGLNVPKSFVHNYHRVNNDLWQLFETGELSARDVRSQRFALLFEHLGLVGDPDVFSEAYLKNLSTYSTFIDGAEQLLERLRGRIGLAALTNGFADVQHARIDRLGLRDVFDHILISEELGVAKPASAVFDIAFERMGHPAKAAVLMIGDSLSSDIQGGANYGIDTCWFNPQKVSNMMAIQPTFEIAHLDDLIDLILPALEQDHG